MTTRLPKNVKRIAIDDRLAPGDMYIVADELLLAGCIEVVQFSVEWMEAHTINTVPPTYMDDAGQLVDAAAIAKIFDGVRRLKFRCTGTADPPPAVSTEPAAPPGKAPPSGSAPN